MKSYILWLHKNTFLLFDEFSDISTLRMEKTIIETYINVKRENFNFKIKF